MELPLDVDNDNEEENPNPLVVGEDGNTVDDYIYNDWGESVE